MDTIYLAGSVIKVMSEASRDGRRELELLYSGPRHPLKDVVRVAAALGGLALYAGILVIVAQ